MAKSKVIKAGIGYTIANYMLKGLTVFTIPIFTRLMSTENFGLYNSFIAYESILFIFIGMAIHSSYKNAKYKYMEKFEEYISSSFIFIIIQFFMYMIIGLFCSHLFLKFLNIDYKSFYLLIMLSFSNAILACINSYYSLNYQYKVYLLVSFINAISNIILSIIFMKTIYSDNTFFARALGTTIPAFLIAVVLIILMLKKAKPKYIVSYVKWGLNYSLPIVPHGISQVLLSQFDRIMIQHLIGLSQAGIYSFAYTVLAIVSVTTNSLGNAWEPWFYEKMNGKEFNNIKKKSALYVIFMTLFISYVMLFSPEIVMLLGTKEYWESIYSVLPIVASGFFTFLYTLPAVVEYFYSKTKFIALGTMIAALVNICLNFIFINKYGYIAASYTTLITYILYFIIHYFIAYKIVGFSLFDNKIILLTIIYILGLVCIISICINQILIRVIIALLVTLVFVAYEEKKFGLIKKRRGR